MTQLFCIPRGVDFLVLQHRFAGSYIANNQYTLKLAEEALADAKAMNKNLAIRRGNCTPPLL